MQKRRVSVIIISVCIVLTACFIWSNSLKSGEVSNRESDVILNFIQWLFGGVFDIEILNFVVRKAAHILEFALFGGELVMLSFIQKKYQLWFVLFSNLSVAVVDEFIQSFFDRTSSVSDVLIDFSGALFGILIGYIICYFIKKLRDKNGKVKAYDNNRDKTGDYSSCCRDKKM